MIKLSVANPLPVDESNNSTDDEFNDEEFDDTSDEFGDRIVGGRYSRPNSYPWMARIEYRGKTACGGSLITDRVVLTAAHCMFKSRGTTMVWVNKKRYRVYFGDNARKAKEPHEQKRKVLATIVHEDYNRGSVHKDIALMVLDKPVEINEYVKPIEISEGAVFPGTSCIVAGWGVHNINKSKSSSKWLKEVDLPIIDTQDCQHTNMRYRMLIDDDMICALSATHGDDSCRGDSGGPLFCEVEEHKFKQVGLTSWGPEVCGATREPGVYTRLTSYADWIKEKLERIERNDFPIDNNPKDNPMAPLSVLLKEKISSIFGNFGR